VGLVATLVLTTIGIIYANPVVLAGTLIPLSYLFYETVSGVPEDRALTVEREIVQETPAPGLPVEVTLTLTNTGESVLPDVRLIDGVPEALAVEAGTPRLCASLSPGESTTLTYSVVTKRGTYAFEDPVVRLRSLAGSERVTTELAVEGDDELVCVSAFESELHQQQTTPYAGVVTTDSGGSGLEFHSTRQYRQGDPVNRIDWHHVAKTGEFITVQYREQKRSRAVVLLDARALNRVTPRPGQPTAVERSVHAGERLYTMFTGAGVQTTVGALGLDENTPDDVGPLLDPEGLAWASQQRDTPPVSAVFDAVTRAGTVETSVGQHTLVAPRVGEDVPPDAGGQSDRSGTGDYRERTADDSTENAADESREQTATNTGDPASARADGGEAVIHLVERIPADAQVVLCSPLLDNWPLALCRRLAETHDLVVVSPEPTGLDNRGQRLTTIHRQLRLQELNELSASTVDWAVGDKFELAVRDALPALATHQ
jgi:hypothetical protein